MAWIESHQSLREHPKTRKAARALGIRPVHLIGHLHALWHWALDMAEDGDLSKFDADDLAIAADWDDDPETFVRALTDCGPGDTPGFLEVDGPCGHPDDAETGALVLHDWWDYAGKLVERRRRDRQRKADRRAEQSDAHPADVVQMSDRRPADSPADSRSREPTNQPTADQPPSPPSGARGARGRRLPDDWRPEPEPDLVAALGGQDAAKVEFAKFRDYWHAKPGKDGRKVDWQATWRNWIRRAAEQQPRQPAGARASPSAQPSTFTQSRRLQ